MQSDLDISAGGLGCGAKARVIFATSGRRESGEGEYKWKVESQGIFNFTLFTSDSGWLPAVPLSSGSQAVFPQFLLFDFFSTFQLLKFYPTRSQKRYVNLDQPTSQMGHLHFHRVHLGRTPVHGHVPATNG